ncbi:MAG: DUF87 domain-containing protein [Actinobacteria bacterium]|nr:DUF87 domain-containing protein [Actinomycetota bacterium]
MLLGDELKKLASVDLLEEVREVDWFVGRPFYVDFARMRILSNDAWKHRAAGLPLGCFLLAAYDNEQETREGVLLRVIGPTPLPSDSDVIASMVDYYKEDLDKTTVGERPDSYTRYEYQFSGLECRILGTFYLDGNGATCFGADVDNFFSANNYSVFKPMGRVLEYIVNFREGTGVPGGGDDVRFGRVRYSSSMRHPLDPEVPVYVSALDFVGKRTALFGMTRTGKSNTVKKLIQSTVEIGERPGSQAVGQIIFDINGEYANANQQDQGTAIFEQYEDVLRYSILAKTGFKIMKVNFYRDIETGFEMLKSLALALDTADYVKSFAAVDLAKPEDESDRSAMTRWQRKIAAYQCVLAAAGFPPGHLGIQFPGCKELNDLSGVAPDRGVTPADAINWFTRVWDQYNTCPYLVNYPNVHGHEWADEDLKALLVFLTRKPTPGGSATRSGFRKLRNVIPYHTDTVDEPYDKEVVSALRSGNVVIIDLSQGDPVVQGIFSERLCVAIFRDAMDAFVANRPVNFIQLYFEEAHNLFPRNSEHDLTNIYNRLAKEGAKLSLGLVYATQEVTSISSNILKNTHRVT